MNLRRVSLSVALFALALLSACALRPRYKDLVQPEGAPRQSVAGETLMMRMVDPNTGQPVQGAKVVAGLSSSRLITTTDAEGRISVLVSKALLEENPLVEVVLPKGVRAYQFQVIRPAEAPAAEPPASKPSEAPAEQDTGSSVPASPAAPDAPAASPSPNPPSPGT